MVMAAVLAARHAEPVAEQPEPEVPERATRRTYSAQYKLRILGEYERRDRDGKGALLRREGLYTSLINPTRDSPTRLSLQNHPRERLLQKERRRVTVARYSGQARHEAVRAADKARIRRWSSVVALDAPLRLEWAARLAHPTLATVSGGHWRSTTG
jgi:hypothetical protein